MFLACEDSLCQARGSHFFNLISTNGVAYLTPLYCGNFPSPWAAGPRCQAEGTQHHAAQAPRQQPCIPSAHLAEMHSSSSSTGQRALNVRVHSLCSAAAHYCLRAAPNQSPASIPAAAFFLSLGCYKQHHLQLQKQLCSPAQALSSSAGPWQMCAPPGQERSVHPSAWASGGVGWAALGDAGGSVVSQKLLG